MSETLFGRPIVFNDATLIETQFGDFFEEVAPYAFNALFARGGEKRAILDREHDPMALLARVSSGTLQLEIGPLGVEASAELADTQLAADTATMIRRGDLSGMSFAFRIDGSTWFDGPNDTPLRLITSVRDLLDVSVVAFPAYPTTRVNMGGGGLRHVVPARIARRHSAAMLRQSLERRGAKIDCPPRLRSLMRVRDKKTVRLGAVSLVTR
ncbi:MAG: HK97 family phage prohead protease [Actinomycetota bacterium]